jgi:hypothetical protein
MSIIRKILKSEIVTLTDLENLEPEECEIVNYLLYNITLDKRFFIRNNKITNLLLNIKDKSDFDYYKKYPLFYQNLVFYYELLQCDFADRQKFISEYPPNEFLTNSRREYHTFVSTNVMPLNPINEYLILCNLITKSNVDNIDIFDENIKIVYTYKISVALGMNETVALIHVKYRLMNLVNMKNSTKITLYKNILNDIDDDTIEHIKDLIKLKYNVLYYNATGDRRYAVVIFSIQKDILQRKPEYFSLYDILYICMIYNEYLPQLEEILSKNIVILSSLQKSKYKNTIISLIKKLTEKSNTTLSDETKSLVEDIFSMELYNQPSSSVKYAGKIN